MKAVVALGSNLENRKLNLDIAITHLEVLLKDLKVSPYFETKPVGGPTQSDFINAVVIGECDLAPEVLLAELLEIEVQMGRVRDLKWGPRIIDLDLIVYGDQKIDTVFLKLEAKPAPAMPEPLSVIRWIA